MKLSFQLLPLVPGSKGGGGGLSRAPAKMAASGALAPGGQLALAPLNVSWNASAVLGQGWNTSQLVRALAADDDVAEQMLFYLLRVFVASSDDPSYALRPAPNH